MEQLIRTACLALLLAGGLLAGASPAAADDGATPEQVGITWEQVGITWEQVGITWEQVGITWEAQEAAPDAE